MSIFSSIGQGLYDFLDKKVDKSKIQTVSGSLATSVHFREIALYIATSYIANTIGKCEFRTYKNGKEEKDWLHYTLNVNPNPNYSGNQFKNKLIYQYFYGDGALVIPKKSRDGGKLYIADEFHVDKSSGLSDWMYSGVKIDDYADSQSYLARNVFYFQQDNKNVKELIDGLYVDYGELLSSAMRQFKELGDKKYKLSIDAVKAGDKKFNEIYEDTIVKQLESFLNNPKAVYPQFEGFNLEEINSGKKNSTSSGGSSDVIDLRKESFEIVSQAIKIPMPLLQGNITNIQEIVRVYLAFCIEPIANMLGTELTRKSFKFKEWENGCYVKVDTSKINHYDIMEAAEKVDKLISSGTTNVDENRELLGMDLLNTEFSRAHFITKNYETSEDALRSEKEVSAG